MRFGIFYEMQLPKPWAPDDERRLFHEALDQVVFASVPQAQINRSRGAGKA